MSLAPWMAAFGLSVGVMVLLADTFSIKRLELIRTEPSLTDPLTAIAIIAAGAAILFVRPFRTSNASLLLGVLAGAIGLFRLTGSGLGWATLSNYFRDADDFNIGLFCSSFGTPVSLMLMGASVSLIRFRQLGLAQLTASLSMLPSYISFLGYLYGFGGASSSMAIPSVVGIATCGIAILSCTSYCPPMRPLLKASRAGYTARNQIAIVHGCFLIASSVSIFLSSHANRLILTVVTSCLWFMAIAIIAHGANVYERTERRSKRAEFALRSLAFEDALTGSLNRRGFFDLAQLAIQQLQREAADGGVLEIDIDHLKTINDLAGTAIGDELIVRLGAIISRTVRKSDVVARLEADRFGVILRNASLSDSSRVADKVLSAFRESCFTEIEGVGNATASAGISSLKTGGYEIQNLLLQVDLALRSAKSKGRNRSEVYRREDATRQSETLKLTYELQHALSRDQISLMFQPQIDLGSGCLVGAEALARWEHPTMGRVPPDRFIPLAESTGYIISIGAWILNSACGQLRRWEDAGHSDMTVAVNVSAHQLKDSGFVDLVLEAVEANRISPGNLVLEITESVSMTSGDIGIEAMRKLSDLGIRIALDDFGTGYSSLSYLRLLPCDYLKIDRSFIMDLPGNKDAVSIARAIIGMGRSLGLTIVAEGIENQEQAEFLQSLWCEEAQGYFYSRPLSPDDFIKWMESWADTTNKAEGAPIWKVV